MDPSPPTLLAFVPITLLSIGFSIAAGLLAQEKGRNVVLWVFLGLTPVLNFWTMPYMIGAANLRLERKLDAIAAQLGLADEDLG